MRQRYNRNKKLCFWSEIARWFVGAVVTVLLVVTLNKKTESTIVTNVNESKCTITHERTGNKTTIHILKGQCVIKLPIDELERIKVKELAFFGA